MLIKYIPEVIKNEFKIFFNKMKYKNSLVLSPYIDKESKLLGNNKILRFAEVYKSEIGKYSYINSNSIVSYSVIGKFTSIGANCSIGTPNHPIEYLSTSPFTYNELSSNMQGVSIGDGVIIGAGAVVTKDIESYSIAVGVPAKVIKKRFNDEKLNYLIENKIEKWWELEEKEIKKMYKYFNENSNWFTV